MNGNDSIVIDGRSLSEALVEDFLLLPADSVPPETLRKTALCVLDTVGVALAAAALGKGGPGIALADAAGSRPESSIWGTGKRTSACDAALVNGLLSHALDYDDTHTASIMHSSTVIVPSVVAIGETIDDMTGRELLTAAIVGYEIAARLGRACPGEMQRHGFHQTAVLGVFAATIAAARLLRLPPPTAVDALGIAGSMAGGLMEFLTDGSDTKPLHAGLAAQSGIRAALLARSGLRGPRTVFEGPNGLFRSFIDRPVDPEIVRAPGERLEVEEMAVKPYPACHCVHSAVDAILEIRKRVPDPDRPVAEIVCEVPSWYLGLVLEPEERKRAPQSAFEGRFSMHFCLASAWIDGALGPDSFSEDVIAEPRRLALAGRVRYEVKEFTEFPQSFPAGVRLRYESGETEACFVPHNRGGNRNPMSEDDVRAKYRDCAGLLAPASAVDALEHAILGLPDAPRLERLTSALSAATTSAAAEEEALAVSQEAVDEIRGAGAFG